MSLNNGLQLPFGIQPVNPIPVDSWSGPYEGTTVQDAIDLANLTIPIEIRFQSMEIRLIVGGIARKFWYRDGISDNDLTEFFIGAVGPTGSDGPIGPIGPTGSTNNSPFYIQGTNEYVYETTSDIYRTGSIAIGTSNSNSKLSIYSTQSGAFQLRDGSEDVGLTLISDEFGVASWTSSVVDRIETLELSITEISEYAYFIEGTYSELKSLKDSSLLIPEKLYILTDYQHKYYIENTNTSNKKTYKNVTGIVSNFMILDNNYEYTLLVGMIVTIESLPSGYTGPLIVGATTSVTQTSSQYYFRFSNGMHFNVANIGVVISFGLPRFTTLTSLIGATISDVNSKIVMKPGGIINTDVHDGTVYGDMSSSENFTPPIESIILKAKTTSSFYEEAESLTFKNDKLIYDFNDSNIINDNLEIIGTRNGFIKRRFNNILKIDINKDWRVQRYRRWLIPEGDYRSQLLNVYHPLTNEFSATQSKYLYTSELIGTASSNYLYIAQSLETTNMTIGLSGSVNNYGITFSSNQDKFKDYPIFRLNSSLEPIRIGECYIDSLNNSVFIGNITNSNLTLSINRMKFIINSTFQGYPMLNGNENVLTNIMSLDEVRISGNFITLTNVNFLSKISDSYMNYVFINNTIFGSLPVNNFLSGLGSLPLNTFVRWIVLNLDNVIIDRTVFGVGYSTFKIADCKIGGGSLFHYGYTLDMRDVNIGSLDIGNVFTGNPTNYKSFYSQSYKVRNINILNKNINITQNINSFTLIGDVNNVIYYENRNILSATTSTMYYNETTKQFTSI